MSLENDNGKFKMIAQGNTAEIYLYDENRIIKLFRENLPAEPIKEEYEKVRSVQSTICSIPKAYEIIKYKGRYGIVYDKIDGVNMINVMLRNVFGVKKYSKMLAHVHSALHMTRGELKISVKDKLNADIDEAAELSEEEKVIIKKRLCRLPERSVLLHFDFHPGNIIIRDNEPVIIDWMTACIGDPAADVARTYLLLQYGELRHANRIVKKLARIFERYICKIYIGEYKRISGISDNDFKKWLLPAAAGRLREWISDNEKEQLLKLIRNELLK